MDFRHQKLISAPLAGITEPVFRGICRSAGADIVFSEMVSAEGLCHKSSKTRELLRILDNERPAGIQLFGARAQSLADAVQAVSDAVHPDFIDLNAGCPVPKVAGKNGGSALLKDPALFGAIVEAMVKASPVPVTVKIRSGWFEHQWVDIEFARIAQESGAAAITVHPRSRSMGFSGKAYRDRIGLVKQAVSIAVIGNGDITEPQHALDMMNQTGCDSVMIGRACMGNPWIFGQIKQLLDGKAVTPISRRQRLDTALEHCRKYRSFHGEQRAAREMKKHIGWYVKGYPGASIVRHRLFMSQSYSELINVLEAYMHDSTWTGELEHGQE